MSLLPSKQGPLHTDREDTTGGVRSPEQSVETREEGSRGLENHSRGAGLHPTPGARELARRCSSELPGIPSFSVPGSR